MNTGAPRYLYAAGLALLAAVQAIVLSLPVGVYLGSRHPPRSEFAGLATLGQVLVTGATCGAVVLAATFLFAAIRYDPASKKWSRAISALLVSLGIFVIGCVTIGFVKGGFAWAIGLNALALAIGIGRALFAE